MDLTELQALEERYLMRTYRRAPVEFVRGEGALLWDAEGKEYLDFLAGISVCSVGHCHPAVVEAVREQAGRLMHVSNLFYTEPMVRLAERLARVEPRRPRLLLQLRAPRPTSARSRSPASTPTGAASRSRRSSASSATSTAAPTARWRRRPALAANEALGPMLPGFRSVPRDDAAALREAVGESTAAVLIEPIQGEAGVYPIADEALLAAREACDEAGALLIFDEIQTGMGRTGSLWAYEQTPVRPDVITTAKALGGGFPIGACVTDAGGRRGARARRPRLDLRRRPGGRRRRPRRARRRRRPGAAARRARAGRRRCARACWRSTASREVRGRGLMLGVGLEEGIDAAAVGADLLERGLVVNVPEPGTLRLLPPLMIDAGRRSSGPSA